MKKESRINSIYIGIAADIGPSRPRLQRKILDLECNSPLTNIQYSLVTAPEIDQ